MYPLNMQLPAPAIGFAVANDEDEHKALTAHGYEPAFVEPAKDEQAPKGKRAAKDERAE